MDPPGYHTHNFELHADWYDTDIAYIYTRQMNLPGSYPMRRLDRPILQMYSPDTWLKLDEQWTKNGLCTYLWLVAPSRCICQVSCKDGWILQVKLPDLVSKPIAYIVYKRTSQMYLPGAPMLLVPFFTDPILRMNPPDKSSMLIDGCQLTWHADPFTEIALQMYLPGTIWLWNRSSPGAPANLVLISTDLTLRMNPPDDIQCQRAAVNWHGTQPQTVK